MNVFDPSSSGGSLGKVFQPSVGSFPLPNTTTIVLVLAVLIFLLNDKPLVKVITAAVAIVAGYFAYVQ